MFQSWIPWLIFIAIGLIILLGVATAPPPLDPHDRPLFEKRWLGERGWTWHPARRPVVDCDRTYLMVDPIDNILLAFPRLDRTRYDGFWRSSDADCERFLEGSPRETVICRTQDVLFIACDEALYRVRLDPGEAEQLFDACEQAERVLPILCACVGDRAQPNAWAELCGAAD